MWFCSYPLDLKDSHKDWYLNSRVFVTPIAGIAGIGGPSRAFAV